MCDVYMLGNREINTQALQGLGFYVLNYASLLYLNIFIHLYFIYDSIYDIYAYTCMCVCEHSFMSNF